MKPIVMIFMSGIILALFIFYIIVLLARPPKKIIDRRSVGCRGGEGCLTEIGANTEVSVLDSHMEETLSRIFVRMEDYFKQQNPYLESNLSIDMVARHLYTNKVYVSKAVKRFSGLNFCQYVNRYRICYSINLYIRRPAIRMIELAHLSGFNSMTSFNISFRAFMKDKPGDWFRTHRQELIDTGWKGGSM